MLQFTKMHGAGNDYIYINCLSGVLPDDVPNLAIRMSDRHTGIGGDGIVLILPSEQADVRMRMFNADGSEAEMCGNAIRCVAKYIFDRNIAQRPTLLIETGRGVLSLDVEAEDGLVQRVRVNMGEPILEADKIPTTLPGAPPLDVPLEVAGEEFRVNCISMGNPHCVLFVEQITDAHVHGLGPQIENHAAFPRRVNVEFIRVISRTEIEMRVWERGSGETLACGTGACAAAVAAYRNNLTERKVRCHLLGGDLELEIAESGEVYMTGPATEVFTGIWQS